MTEHISDEIDTSDDYQNCTVKCSKIIDSNSGATCSKTCCKKATPAHQSYGSHYCSDHK